MKHELVIAGVLAATTPVSSLAKEADEDRNGAIVRKHHELINAGKLDEAAALYADRIDNNGNTIDRARITAIIRDNSTAFPDWKMTIERLVSQGDTVVALIRVTGTHRGKSTRPVNGGTYYDIAPTGRSFSVLHTHWFTLKDGKIVSHRATRDDLGMARQLGLVPPGPARLPDAVPAR